MVDGPGGLRPLAFMRMTMLHQGDISASASSDRAGNFHFPRDVPAGFYDLTLDSDRYEANLAFEFDRSTPPLLVIAKPRPPSIR
jgi:hypothetical protein